MKKSKLNFMKLLLMFGLIPLIVSVTIVDIMACEFLKSSLKENTRSTIQIASENLANYYHAELVNYGEISEDRTYVDSFHEHNIELTVFLGDTRKLSSIRDENGNRIEGTKADPEVVDEVINKGNTFYSDDIEINNEMYYVHYSPLKDADGNIVGMAFAGEAVANVEHASNKLLRTFMIIGTINIFVFTVLIIFFARMIKKPLGKIADSLEVLADGDLGQEIEIKSIVNETKRIIDSTKKLQENLCETVSNVRETAIALSDSVDEVDELSGNIAGGTEQITNAVVELSSGAVNMADNVQGVNTKVVNIGDSINDITGNVENLGASSAVIKGQVMKLRFV